MHIKIEETVGAPGWLSRLGVQLLISTHDLRVLGSSPVLGSALSGESAGDSLSPSPSLPLPASHAPMLARSLSNK